MVNRQVPTLSIILLTHATPAHIAAFAHCCKHFPLFTRIPIYATIPVINLGRTLLQDLYASTPLASSIIPTAALSESAYSLPTEQASSGSNILLQPPTTDEIAGYFSLIHPLKYSQPHQPLPSPFSPPLNGLTITAYSAGHTLGGTLWHIQHGLESIVYAVDWNQAREHVLSGAAWLGSGSGAEVIEQLRRPTALICSSRGAERVAIAGGRKRRDEVLVELIEDTLKKGGTVLIPSDSSARVLELAYLLEETWYNKKEKEDSRLYKDAKLFMASRTASATMRYARSMLEWMEEGIVREFEAAAAAQSKNDNRSNNRGHRRQNSRNNADDKEPTAAHSPFSFQHLKLLGRKQQIDRMLAFQNPKVIIASDQSLEWGFSRDVLRAIANDSRNLVILTERVGPVSNIKKGLGALLWELFEAKNNGAHDNGNFNGFIATEGHGVTIQTTEARPLEGSELILYQQYQAKKRQLQTTMQADGATALETSADVVDDRSSITSESSDDEDEEQQGKVLNVSAAMSQSRNKLGLSDAELGVNILLRRKGIHDFDVRGKKGREKTFPFAPKRRKNDEFGDLIRPEEYLRAEERDDVDGEDMRDGQTKQATAVGEKRKWDDPTGVGKLTNGAGKRSKHDTLSGDALMTDDAGDASRNAMGIDSDSEGSDDGEGRSSSEGPLKVVFGQETLQLHVRIAFVDFGGLHDKRSLHMLIPLIRPRKLILVGGEEGETLALAADCRKLLGVGLGESSESRTDVFTPAPGKTIDASVDTNAWVVKLSQSFAMRLKWQTVRGLGVVAIAGRLETSAEDDEKDDEGTRKKQKTAGSEADTAAENVATKPIDDDLAKAPVLDVVPASMATATRSVAQPLHVGDLRLADLRKILQASGHTAEFRGEGTLLIDGIIAVRKSGTGKIDVEGGLSLHGPRRTDASFYEVRKKIYDGLALVAGG